MAAHLFTKEEIIDLKNCFACAKTALENYQFFNRNKKDISKYYRCMVHDLFEYCTALLGIGWTSKPYKWLKEKIDTFDKTDEFKKIFNKFKDKFYAPEEFVKPIFMEAIKYQIDFYAWFISTPGTKGYAEYINNKITDAKATKYLNKYISIVEKIHNGCPPFNEESKYWHAMFRENNKFNKSLFNK